MEKNVIDWIALVLVIVGAVNWGLVGVANIDLVSYLPSIVARIVYILVGLAGLWTIYLATKK